VKTLRVSDRAGWRVWLDRNHQSEKEVWLVLRKRHSKKKWISYDEAVEEALCYGWIDGIIRRVDEASYVQRFTPRKPGSNWSRSNMARFRRLVSEGRMAAPGLAAFEEGGAEKWSAQFFELGSLLDRRNRRSEPYSEFLRIPTMSTGIYVLKKGETDLQRAHVEDELYYVIEGRSMFRAADQDRKVGPGTLIFVPSGVGHSFYDIEAKLVVLVFFAPVET
jgi:mannose-6-phosphate isomerase-like protein (cupin superfamily)